MDNWPKGCSNVPLDMLNSVDWSLAELLLLTSCGRMPTAFIEGQNEWNEKQPMKLHPGKEWFRQTHLSNFSPISILETVSASEQWDYSLWTVQAIHLIIFPSLKWLFLGRAKCPVYFCCTLSVSKLSRLIFPFTLLSLPIVHLSSLFVSFIKSFLEQNKYK